MTGKSPVINRYAIQLPTINGSVLARQPRHQTPGSLRTSE